MGDEGGGSRKDLKTKVGWRRCGEPVGCEDLTKLVISDSRKYKKKNRSKGQEGISCEGFRGAPTRVFLYRRGCKRRNGGGEKGTLRSWWAGVGGGRATSKQNTPLEQEKGKQRENQNGGKRKEGGGKGKPKPLVLSRTEKQAGGGGGNNIDKLGYAQRPSARAAIGQWREKKKRQWSSQITSGVNCPRRGEKKRGQKKGYWKGNSSRELVIAGEIFDMGTTWANIWGD